MKIHVRSPFNSLFIEFLLILEYFNDIFSSIKLIKIHVFCLEGYTNIFTNSHIFELLCSSDLY